MDGKTSKKSKKASPLVPCRRVSKVHDRHFLVPSDKFIRDVLDGGGFVENREFEDLRGFRLKDYRHFEAEEDVLLRYVSAGGDLSSAEAEKRFGDYESWKFGLDPGMISVVIALSVIGACPITSCVGGDGHLECHPIVSFYCSRKLFPRIRKAAAAAHISLRGSPNGIVAYHLEDWRPFRKFARALVQR
jgi:hypothetical protein